ncbi:PilZ domain-containing protein [Mesorhizobium sp. 128a]
MGFSSSNQRKEPVPTDPPVERRSHIRDLVLKEATIQSGDAIINCLVCNQHAHGAELRVKADIAIPDRFVLHVPVDQTSYRAVVRWRRKERLGVQLDSGRQT